MDSHLSNDEFFEGLAKLFENRRGKDHGAVYLVQKQFAYSQDTEGVSAQTSSHGSDLQSLQPRPILVRATNGKSKDRVADKVKLSTVVQPDVIGEFFARYAEVCKAGMLTLKPRDKSKKKAKAKKRKVGVPSAV